MGQYLDVVTQHLDKKDFRYHAHQDEPGRDIVELTVTGENCRFNVRVICEEEKERVMVYSHFPILCPEDKRIRIAEAVCRANYGLILGNLELDMRDGEVRYKTSIDVGGQKMTDDFVKALLGANFATVDRYVPALLDVMYGGKLPKAAVEKCEGDRPPRRKRGAEPDDAADDAPSSSSGTPQTPSSGTGDPHEREGRDVTPDEARHILEERLKAAGLHAGSNGGNAPAETAGEIPKEPTPEPELEPPSTVPAGEGAADCGGDPGNPEEPPPGSPGS